MNHTLIISISKEVTGGTEAQILLNKLKNIMIGELGIVLSARVTTDLDTAIGASMDEVITGRPPIRDEPTGGP